MENWAVVDIVVVVEAAAADIAAAEVAVDTAASADIAVAAADIAVAVVQLNIHCCIALACLDSTFQG